MTKKGSNNGGGRKNGFTAAQMIEAIEGAAGNLTLAAQSLKCSRTTVYRYVRDYATVKDAVEEQREVTLDFVENQLLSLCRDRDKTSIYFYLNNQGQSRGYGNKVELTGPNDGPLQISVKLGEVE